MRNVAYQMNAGVGQPCRLPPNVSCRRCRACVCPSGVQAADRFFPYVSAAKDEIYGEDEYRVGADFLGVRHQVAGYGFH